MAGVLEYLALCVLFLTNYCSFSAEWNSNDYMKREHSLIKPYQDGRWDFVGSTMMTNQFIRITPDHQSKRGGIWNNLACYVRAWELHVHFKVHGQGRDLFGDGMAIWYTRNRLQTGPVFGNQDYFDGLAIFIDTYSNQNGPHNHGHPYISAMVNNGSMSYDHDRDGTHTEVAGCEAQVRGKATDTYIAIRYEKNTLTVSTDIDGKNTWKECFSAQGVRLPVGYFFGATAATGDLADNHDIISMKLYDVASEDSSGSVSLSDEELRKVIPSADIFAPPRDHVEDPKGAFMLGSMSGWKLLVVIILIIIGLTVCGVVGFVVFAKRQEQSRKRFY